MYQAQPSDTRTIVHRDLSFSLPAVFSSLLMHYFSCYFLWLVRKLLLIHSSSDTRFVLWGNRANEFDAEEVCTTGKKAAGIGIFVGTLTKMIHSSYFCHCTPLPYFFNLCQPINRLALLAACLAWYKKFAIVQ